MSTIALLAKGASVHRLLHHAQASDAVASINDAMRVMPDTIMRYCFFSDANVYDVLEPFDKQVQTYVTREPVDDDFASVPDYIRKKWCTYPDRFCDGDLASIEQRVLDGGIAHHSTVPAAIHWLSKHTSYSTILVLGVDGGGDYADDMWRLGRADLYLWRTIALRTAAVCTKVYAKKIEFHDARSDPS